METVLIIIIIALAAVIIFQSIRINKNLNSKNQDQGINLLKMDVIELNKSLNRLRETLD